ncbi:hypothetical protein CcCBS67573_g06401 [Chytriomyces confervae]|uniref:Uncharacterized protein n=1 Tax=Chytriomyces confervae TaxID=246404 RepID=A0A507F5A4_9FUNG|nr:hypothetical protein CcCBS67573_g06401 [Chytriomyces confervae]
MFARCFALYPTIHARISVNSRRIPLAIVFIRDVKPSLHRHHATSTTRYAASKGPRNIRKALVKLVGQQSADKLLSSKGFAYRADALLPTLDHLTNKFGEKNAVRLLSTDSFCARHEALIPVFETLSAKLGTTSAVMLLSSDNIQAYEKRVENDGQTNINPGAKGKALLLRLGRRDVATSTERCRWALATAAGEKPQVVISLKETLYPLPTAGSISNFSSPGLSPELDIKRDWEQLVNIDWNILYATEQ